MTTVRRICDETGVLLIVDEVMSGFGRTGEWFAVNNWDVQPDIMTMAKGLTSSHLPLGAVAVSQDGTTIVGEGFNPDDQFEAWRARLPRDVLGDENIAPASESGITESNEQHQNVHQRPGSTDDE